MSKLFSDNAYSVLGLNTSASQKDITNRSKEIHRTLFLDESPEFETDIDTINKTQRSESSVNNAIQRLSSRIKRIHEYFFWFEIENDKDEKDLSLLRDNQYDEALDNWKERSEKSLTAKRNLAIASSLLLSHTGYKKYLKLSVDAWKEVVESDKFWSHFEKVYALNDEIGTSRTAIDDFRNKVVDVLSDFYTDVSRSKNDKSIYAAFSKAIGAKGQKVQDEVLAPIFERINDASKQLHDLKVSKDGTLSQQKTMAIKRLVKRLQDSFQEIKDLGLFEDSQVKVMRDKAAEAINIVAVDIFNNLDEKTKASALVKVAQSLATGPAVLSRIDKNVKIMRDVSSQEKILKPINELIEAEDYESALEEIREALVQHKRDKDTQAFLIRTQKMCIAVIAMNQYNAGKALMDKNNYSQAKVLLSTNVEFILDYINNESGINEENATHLSAVLSEINRLSFLLGKDKDAGNNIDNYRNGIVQQAKIGMDDEYDQTIFIYLIDSQILANLAQKLPELKRNKTLKSVVGWVVTIGIFLAISAASSNNNSTNGNTGSTSGSSSSSTSSAWATCNSEYNSLNSQLSSVQSEMDSDKSAGNTDAYNALVPQQNSLVQQVNNKATECNNLR